MLYYGRRPTPLPRVAAGITDSWDSSIDILDPGGDPIWSPCGRFVATRAEEAVEIRNSLTAKLLFTLQPGGSTPRLMGVPAYSPDGRSLACPSDTAIIVWDIQTGGVVKEIQLDASYSTLLVWSLDGRSICATDWDWKDGQCTVRTFDVVSGTKQSSTIPHSESRPHLWAHGESFRVMMCAKTGLARNFTIDIFEVGPTLTKIESFDFRDIEVEVDWRIGSFSPTTHRISVSSPSWDRLLVLDIRNSGRLLDETQEFGSHCFSPDSGFFAAAWEWGIQIWKYDGSSYVAWRKLPILDGADYLLFSPTSSSVLGVFEDIFRVWHLDGLSAPPTPHSKQFGALPHSGAYLVTTSNRGNTITITDFLSRTPLQLIDTDIKICGLGLTGNVLLVEGSEVVVAWLLTEEGLVDGVFGDRTAGRGDSIWTVPIPQAFMLSVEGETVVIECGDARHVYNTRTGEVLELFQTAPNRDSYYFLGYMAEARSRLAPPRDDWNPLQNVTKGWVEDRGGKRLLWLPIEWRGMHLVETKWFSDIGVIQFWVPYSKIVTIKLY